jgi:hypothetical protein
MRCVSEFYKQRQPKRQEQEKEDFLMKKRKDALRHLKNAYRDDREQTYPSN